jgi:hypothetical protein
MSHTTFMRRTNEDVKPAKIIEVGTRSVSREELEYAKEAKVELILGQEIREQGATAAAAKLKEKLAPFKTVYLSVDMDILTRPARGTDVPTVYDQLSYAFPFRLYHVPVVRSWKTHSIMVPLEKGPIVAEKFPSLEL